MSKPTQTLAWRNLRRESEGFKTPDFRLEDLFAGDNNRFDRFSISTDHLLLDYSKNYLTEQSFKLLIDLANECKLPTSIAAMFSGDKINYSENRAALHVALRDPDSDLSEVGETLDKISGLVEALHDGNFKGYGGTQITDVVNIGIGGSNLGPVLLCEAFADFVNEIPHVHFVSNIDPSHLRSTLSSLNPASTLFIIASKSFTTIETQQNAEMARLWLLNHLPDERALSAHFIAITENVQAAQEFGISTDNLFPIWDWVGGRYSLWSAVGLPIAIAIGMKNFRELLAGAHSMDQHFQRTALHENMPVIMGLLTVLYTGFFNSHSTAIVPYSQRLKLLPTYLQQLHMESLGKSVDVTGGPVSTNTGEIIWGTAGTDAQHSYFQLLHQGTRFIPIDFIAVAKPMFNKEQEQHQYLLANCFGQSLSLMRGHTDSEAPHKNVPGNKPCNTLVLEELSPYNLGSLIALYEHKVFVQSAIWNINPFDQWGVEFGKNVAQEVFDSLSKNPVTIDFDASTNGLIRFIKKWNN